MPTEEIDKPKIPSQNLFPVVGIGASAGGLEAFKKLIAAIPDNSGMAYILVQHLHPEHESALPEILQRVSKIPVVEISNNVQVAPDHIYVIPSNKMMVATDGVLKLSPRLAKDRLNLPINIFFSSLAEVHQSHAIGVILSGTGADGTIGLQDIKEQGGLTFVQDPASAAYDGMPQHAIDAGIVDYIIAPEKISEKLLALQQTYAIAEPGDPSEIKDKLNEETFRQVLALLRMRVGVDFNFYKQTTVRRRIIRHMVMLQLENITAYLEYLKKNKTELDILFQDLLIPVTSFFRDPATFDILCDTVFPEIIKNQAAGGPAGYSAKPLRLWIAGCSTGQEAYSIAMCLQEYLNDTINAGKVQIFATDISEKAIKKARAAIYTKKELEGISDKRLQQFFIKKDGHFQVKKTVRDMCIFAVHNFLKDPPFAKMDFISCRNVLIYLEPFLQKKALTLFHYALNDKGILLLGKSETSGNATDIFIPFGKKDKYFIKKTIPGRFINVTSERSETAIADKNYFMRIKEGKTEDYQKNADEILLQKYTPVGVVVNEQFDIVQFRGSTGEYLEPSPGKASLNVLKMAKDGLAFEIRNALHKAKTSSEPVIKDGIPINKGKNIVTIEVIPLLNTIERYFLILFCPSPPAPQRGDVGEGIPENEYPSIEGSENPSLVGGRARIVQLEKELAQAREDMKNITEDQEAANEELQSSNEELLSGSEELQSLNEELETSKEELQSTNEELITVNQELYDRNEELNQSRKFAEATLGVLHEPLLVLDKYFIIKSANDAFYKTFQLTEEEVLTKKLFDLQNNGWDIPGLRNDLERIQHEKEKMLELESTFTFPVIGERTICFNIQPIHRENGEELIILALEDITKRKNTEQVINESEAKFRNLIVQAPVLITILQGPSFIIQTINKTALEVWGKTYDQVINKPLFESSPELEEQFKSILNDVYTTGESFIADEISVQIKRIGKPDTAYFNSVYQPLRNLNNEIYGIIIIGTEVTESVNGKREIEASENRFSNILKQSLMAIGILKGPDLILNFANEPLIIAWGKGNDIVGKTLLEILPELDETEFPKLIRQVYTTGVPYYGYETKVMLNRNGEWEETYFNFVYHPYTETDDTITGVTILATEVTLQVFAKKMQEEAAERFTILNNAMPQKMWMADEQGSVNYLNQQWLEYTNKSYDELKNLGWEKIIHPDDWNHNKQTWINSISTGEDFKLEHRFLCKDGNYYWHLSRGHAHKNESGKVLVWIGTHTDIDEQKKKELQKDEFISIASHEMKTPLTTAKAYLQLLELSLDKQNDTIYLYAKKASLAVTRLNELISELLDVSKIQHGKLDYNFSRFNFNEMIDTAVEDTQHASQKHTIKKTGQVTKEITGDKERLKQVVLNLLSNAIKYSPDSLDVYIDLTQNDNEIKVVVKDNGIGIPSQHLAKIFDRYYRVEEHAIKFQGLGIGLFISHEVIQRHHGKLWVKSEAGKGSTFYFTIPAGN